MVDKAQWIEGPYGFSYLNLPGGFQATVGYENGGYRVRFEHAELAARFETVIQAKQYAVKLARKKLTAALDALPD